MRFLVLGSGMQGRACAFDMLQNDDVREVLLADSSRESLASAKRFLRSPRIKTLLLDATDTAKVVKLAKGCSAMVSCVPYFFNLKLAKAAIAAKTHFVDLGGNTDIVRRELALHPQAVKAGVTLLPDVGLGPGMTTTIAVHGMSRLDRTDEVLIRDGGLPQDPVPPMNYLLTFSEHGLINEYIEDAAALRGGRIVKVPGLSETESLDLPGFGRMEAAHAAGGVSTMPYTFAGKVQTMDVKLIRFPGHIAVINAMHSMGFFSSKKLHFGSATASPRELSGLLFRRAFLRPGQKDQVVIRVTVRGMKDGRRAEVVYDGLDKYDEKNRMTAMMRTTGFPASIVAQMAATGVIDKPGAYPVETGVPPEPFLAEMKKRGLNLTSRFTYLDKPAPVAA